MRFRGAVAESQWDRTWPMNSLTVSRRGLAISPGIVRPATFIKKQELRSVAVERLRNPLMYRTIVWFSWQPDEEPQEERIGFIPWRRRAFLQALEDSGFKVVTHEGTEKRPRP